MARTEVRIPPVPVLVALGLAVWTVIVAAFASVQHGYYVPAGFEIGVLVLAAVLFCRNEARHAGSRR